MSLLLELAERGKLPDRLIRFGIRKLDKQRLKMEQRANINETHGALSRLIEGMRQSPIAFRPEKANEQHYELPADYFKWVLGKHLKIGIQFDDLLRDDLLGVLLELLVERRDRHGAVVVARVHACLAW